MAETIREARPDDGAASDNEGGGEGMAQSTPQDATAQRILLDRFVGVIQEDMRILAAWTIGSLARGTADAFSDVDILLAVRDQEFAAFSEDWPAFVARLAPTTSVRQLGPPDKPTITAITPDWQRFDITFFSAADSHPHGYDAAALLFSRDGVAPPATFGAAAGRDPWIRLPSLVEEFLRVLGLLPIAVGRGEFIAGLTPVMLLRGYLIDLLLLQNGSQRGGAKRLNPLLTEEQRHALLALPPLTPTREDVIAGHLACARLFLPLARRLTAERQLSYPDAFERTTLAHLQRTLGLAL